jgi:hypothetical protein
MNASASVSALERLPESFGEVRDVLNELTRIVR